MNSGFGDHVESFPRFPPLTNCYPSWLRRARWSRTSSETNAVGVRRVKQWGGAGDVSLWLLNSCTHTSLFLGLSGRASLHTPPGFHRNRYRLHPSRLTSTNAQTRQRLPGRSEKAAMSGRWHRPIDVTSDTAMPCGIWHRHYCSRTTCVSV